KFQIPRKTQTFKIATPTFWNLFGAWDLDVGIFGSDGCKRQLIDRPRLVELHARCFEAWAALLLRALRIQCYAHRLATATQDQLPDFKIQSDLVRHQVERSE